MASAGMTNVATRPHHPQSNVRQERFHRTLREEVEIDEEDDLYQVREWIETYRVYHNERRPPSALRFLRPVDYYRGDPQARLAERARKPRLAAQARRAYWRP